MKLYVFPQFIKVGVSSCVALGRRKEGGWCVYHAQYDERRRGSDRKVPEGFQLSQSIYEAVCDEVSGQRHLLEAAHDADHRDQSVNNPLSLRKLATVERDAKGCDGNAVLFHAQQTGHDCRIIDLRTERKVESFQ